MVERMPSMSDRRIHFTDNSCRLVRKMGLRETVVELLLDSFVTRQSSISITSSLDKERKTGSRSSIVAGIFNSDKFRNSVHWAIIIQETGVCSRWSLLSSGKFPSKSSITSGGESIQLEHPTDTSVRSGACPFVASLRKLGLLHHASRAN